MDRYRFEQLDSNERVRVLLDWNKSVVHGLCERMMPGVQAESMDSRALYVIDKGKGWGLEVEWVESIAGGVVETNFSSYPQEEFAGWVLAGPFWP